jgi:enoyl-CoA hydratase
MLTTDLRDGVALLRLDRPPANALDRAVFDAFTATLARLEADAAVRAVVVTGTGRFFSAGLDLFAVFADDAAGFDAFTRAFDAGWRALFGFPKPLIAAVNGHAIAGGAVLAACADVRLLADGDARLGFTEIQVGVTFPASALEPVRWACAGPHLAELLCRGLTHPPAEALVRRLVDEVVPADALLPRATALAAELGALPPSAYATTKRALRADGLARMAAHAPGADPIWDDWRSEAVRAAVEAYRERTLGAKQR